jgi:hypothetical protein
MNTICLIVKKPEGDFEQKRNTYEIQESPSGIDFKDEKLFCPFARKVEV